MSKSKGKIDPVCLVHGKRMSQHRCLYCCLCFKSLTPEECNVREDGQKEDVCKPCALKEKQALLLKQKRKENEKTGGT